MDTPSVQTLKQIVKGIHFEGGYDADNWPFIGQYAINAVREIHMLHAKTRKVIKVDVDTQTNTIDWPDDYLGLCFLGIPKNGQVWTLTRNNDIIITTSLINGQETLNPLQGEGVPIKDGSTYGYGAHGGKNKFYYTEDEVNRRIFLEGVNPKNIILGYISSGIEDKDTLIPVKYKDIIIAYVRWKTYEREDIFNANKAQYFKNEYMEAVSKLKVFEGPTLDEVSSASVVTIVYKRPTGRRGCGSILRLASHHGQTKIRRVCRRDGL